MSTQEFVDPSAKAINAISQSSGIAGVGEEAAAVEAREGEGEGGANSSGNAAAKGGALGARMMLCS